MEKLFFYLATVAMCLSSCSTDEQTGKPDPGKEVPLGIGSVMTTDVVTRVNSTPLVTDGAAIGLYLFESTPYKDVNNVKYVYQTAAPAGWKPESEANVIHLDENEAKICAYYPYDERRIEAGPIFTLTPTLYGSALQDLCFSKSAPFTNSNSIANFIMKHAYSKITFTVTRDETYNNKCAIPEARVRDIPDNKVKGIYTEAVLNISSDVLTDQTTTDKGFIYSPNVTGILVGEKASFSLLMVPSPFLGENTGCGFQVDGNRLEAVIPKSKLAELKAGTNYNINILITGEGLKVTSVKIIDWDDVEIVDPIIPV